MSYLDETHQRIAEFADEFLDDDERDGFVDSLMERRGYKRSSHWEPPDPEQGGGRQPLVRPRAPGGKQQGQGGGQRTYFKGAGK